jgi:deazaflavin-dependent oxidoreductase (nitroreductase family)
LRKLAHYIGRQPWLATIGPRIVGLDTTLQRWTSGRIALSRLGGMTTVLLTTTGRKTGQPRHTPLIAIPEGGSLLLIASNFGKPGHPAWSTNLIAHPDAIVRTRGHAFPITATLLTGEDRTQAWKTAAAAWPAYHEYATRSGREIRLFRVELQ